VGTALLVDAAQMGANFESYAIVRLGVEGIDGKPLKLRLQDVLHLPSVLVNLFSGQLFEKGCFEVFSLRTRQEY
jgi:hypothetical protein